MLDDEMEIITGCAAAHPGQRGGQHVGNCASILVIHKPTGIGVRIDEERSQFKNKKLAVERLRVLVDLWENRPQ